jgi:hypothetical protein
MADASVLEISKAKPIGKRLDAFHDSFSFVCEDAGVPEALESLDLLGKEGMLATLPLRCT